MSGKLVFVSYAHDDEKFLNGTFLPFLKQLELNEQIELWHDRLIGVGEDWYEQIVRAARDKDAATATLTKARELITEMSYGRRLKELAELEAELGISNA